MSNCRHPRLVLVVSAFCVAMLLSAADSPVVSAERQFRAGAAEVNVSPENFPVIISGGFLQGRGDQLTDPLFARALVLDDGATRLAIVMVDTLMMPRELVDDAKKSIEQRTGIPSDRIMVAATHTHTAPSVMVRWGPESTAAMPIGSRAGSLKVWWAQSRTSCPLESVGPWPSTASTRIAGGGSTVRTASRPIRLAIVRSVR